MIDRRATGRRALARALGVLLAPLAATLLLVGPARADEAAPGATISHVETSGEGLRVLVSVPPGADVDLSGVTATLDGDDLDATASDAGEGSVVQRTAILAMDTSNSMRHQGRFDAAKQAALTYLDSVPDDVSVGIVSFDSDVRVDLAPTTDRDAARTVVDGLTLSRDTLLYDGIASAVSTAGDTGQRSVLVLSDGADTGSAASLQAVTGTIEDADALVDVVSLGQRGKSLHALEALAQAGRGTVIESSGKALGATFRREADVLSRQVLVTVPLPDGFDADQATVSVELPSGGSTLTATALAPIEQGATTTKPAALPAPAGSAGWEAPGWLLYAGIAVLALGAIAAAVLLVPGRPAPMTIAERVTAYSNQMHPAREPETLKPVSEPMLDQAKAAAESVLERNQDLDAKLNRRLTAAGSELKPSEWLLLHIGVVIAALLLGLLVGKGNLLIAILFLAVGFFLPPLYLRWKAGRRRKAFNAVLPDTLQLVSGALSAGLSLAQAVDTVVREGQEPIASEFKRVLVENRIGVPLEDAFDGVAERFESKDFAWVVMAIRIQRQVGGNLAELLTTVADTMRERQYLRRQVQTLAAEGKLSAFVLCVLPPGFFLYVLVAKRSYIDPMFHLALGWGMLIGAALWLAIGVFWMSRMIKAVEAS